MCIPPIYGSVREDRDDEICLQATGRRGKLRVIREGEELMWIGETGGGGDREGQRRLRR